MASLSSVFLPDDILMVGSDKDSSVVSFVFAVDLPSGTALKGTPDETDVPPPPVDVPVEIVVAPAE